MFYKQNPYGKDNPHALRNRLICTVIINLSLALSPLGSYYAINAVRGPHNQITIIESSEK